MLFVNAKASNIAQEVTMENLAVNFNLVLMLFASTCTATETIGSVVPPFPKGWQHEGGSCVADCNFSIGELRAPNGLAFFLGKSAQRVDPNKPRWLVLDLMPYPKTPKGYQVVYSLCERDGNSDETIIAIVKTTDTEWYSTVFRAYKANLNAGRFETTSTKGVRCLNDGWGL